MFIAIGPRVWTTDIQLCLSAVFCHRNCFSNNLDIMCELPFWNPLPRLWAELQHSCRVLWQKGGWCLDFSPTLLPMTTQLQKLQVCMVMSVSANGHGLVVVPLWSPLLVIIASLPDTSCPLAPFVSLACKCWLSHASYLLVLLGEPSF